MDITDATYVSLVTFRDDGKRVPTPVWIVDLGEGCAGVITGADSGKVRRLRSDPRVTLTPCDQRGRTDDDATTVSGTAVVDDGEILRRVRAAVADKYPVQSRVIEVLGRVGRLVGRSRDDRVGVAITLDSRPSPAPRRPRAVRPDARPPRRPRPGTGLTCATPPPAAPPRPRRPTRRTRRRARWPTPASRPPSRPTSPTRSPRRRPGRPPPRPTIVRAHWTDRSPSPTPNSPNPNNPASNSPNPTTRPPDPG